ncbi:septation ring formation regulator EzrA [Mycoplasma amphoriforme]|uniref:Septation ring formation regulator EzrA n=1 Tax=Mycoplasma amphoriforme A39 TaxID=572419 RepID=A0A292IIK4_9MOLU|nr:unnamed protein product [Mycoplasma amphoriforme A39]
MTFTVSHYLAFILIFLFIIALIVYSIYAFIFVRVRKSVNQLYKDQNTYNELSANSFIGATKPFELLSRNKRYLEHVVTYMKNFDAHYKSQLNTTLASINELTNLKNHFDLKFAKSTSAQINNYFLVLNDLKKHFNELTVNSSIYQNSASRLVVTYRNLVNNLSLFLKQHILPKYDSVIFKDSLNNISSVFNDADDSYNTLKNDIFIKNMENLRKVIHSLLVCVNKLYTLDKKNDYVKFLIKEINLHYQQSRKDPNVSQFSQLNGIYRVISESSLSVQKVDEHLHLFEFKESEVKIQDLLTILVPLKKHLYDESHAKQIINSGFENFIKSANLFETKYHELAQAINKVGENFSRDVEITTRTNQIDQHLNEIREAIQSMQFEREQQKDDYSVLLEKMNFIISAISTLRTRLEELILIADKKMNIYKNVIYGINNLKLRYSQLESIIENNKFFPDQLTINEFLTLKQEVDLKEKALYSDYNLAIKNFDEFAKNANKTFIKTLKVIVDLATLKEISRAIFLYLNKYRSESSDIQKHLVLIEEVFDEGDYEKCVHSLIRVLEIMKQSAAKFNMNLN